MGVLRTVFCVYNNPRQDTIYKTDDKGEFLKDENEKRIIHSVLDNEYTNLADKEITKLFLDKWVSSKEGRSGAVALCVSQHGMEHFHLVLECQRETSFTYKTVKKIFGNKIHIEPTKGSKEQATDYIYKRGKFEDNKEVIKHIEVFGEIRGKQGNRSDFTEIENLLAEGKTP